MRLRVVDVFDDAALTTSKRAPLTFVGLTDFMERWLNKVGYDWLEAAIIRGRLQETTCWVVRRQIF